MLSGEIALKNNHYYYYYYVWVFHIFDFPQFFSTFHVKTMVTGFANVRVMVLNFVIADWTFFIRRDIQCSEMDHLALHILTDPSGVFLEGTTFLSEKTRYWLDNIQNPAHGDGRLPAQLFSCLAEEFSSFHLMI